MAKKSAWDKINGLSRLHSANSFFCILMVFALPLPADCKLYSGRNNDEQLPATTEQAACIHRLKWMLYGDSTMSTQAAGGYLDSLAILTMYAQCTLLDPLLQY